MLLTIVYVWQIESALRNSPFVENVCVCTDPYSNHVAALISPNHRTLLELGKTLSKPNLTFEQLCDDSDVNRHICKSIKESSKKLDLKVREVPEIITLVKEEWNQENNLLTAAMKMKRKQVNDFYREQIKLMFAQQNVQTETKKVTNSNVA